jgi:hypothetical protein
MKINLIKLKNILDKKTNKAIENLEKYKCSSEEYKNILNSIFNNLEKIKKLEEFDINCENCENENNENNQENKENNIEIKEENKSVVGRKWSSYGK